MVADRKRQKKLEKGRKRREFVKKQRRQHELRFQGASLLRLAQAAPFGPAWISRAIDEPEADQTCSLLTVVVTRRLRGFLLAEIVIVERTCRGVKEAILLPLISEADLVDRLDALAGGRAVFRSCEPLEAQSVVFHALDYAGSLGFFAHEDFESAIFEPRPAQLLDTPLAKPALPTYISGPNDDFRKILEHLNRVVGPENYVISLGIGDPGGPFDADQFADDAFELADFDGLETVGECSVDSGE